MSEDRMDFEEWIAQIKEQYPDPVGVRKKKREKRLLERKLVVVHPNESGGQTAHVFSPMADMKHGEEYCLRNLDKDKVWERNYCVENCRYVKEWGSLGFTHRISTDLSKINWGYCWVTPSGEFTSEERLFPMTDLISSLHSLVNYHGYDLVVEGYDQEERFVKSGLVRTTHPKVVQANDGAYTAAIRCASCDKKVDCICDSDFYSILEKAFYLKWYCWSCAARDYIREYETDGPNERYDLVKEFLGNRIDFIGPDEAERQGLYEVNPLEYAKANMDEFEDFYTEVHEDCYEEDWCECPLDL